MKTGGRARSIAHSPLKDRSQTAGGWSGSVSVSTNPWGITDTDVASTRAESRATNVIRTLSASSWLSWRQQVELSVAPTLTLVAPGRRGNVGGAE